MLRQQPAPPQGGRAHQSLRDYATRAFSKCTSDEERDLMERLIKEAIQKVRDAGQFYSTDWDKVELPRLPREQALLEVPPAYPPLFFPHVPKVRRSRFEPTEVPPQVEVRKKPKLAEPEERDWKIQGTCQDIEKPYFRLTSKPDPATLRPEPVLRRALAIFKERWRRGEISYEYYSEQLRSIRQDLTVQGIKNKFAVEVYQVHVRLALEAGDIDQFNASMSRLFELFKDGLPGRKTVSST